MNYKRLKKNQIKLGLGILCLSLMAIGCGKKASDVNELDATEAVIEAGLVQISGSSDEQSAVDYAFHKGSNNPFLSLILNPAQATSCIRPRLQACNNGLQESLFENCTPMNKNHARTGSVRLTYSSSSCSMAEVGDQVNRSFDISIAGPRGASYSHSSQEQADYRGELYGGGSTLERLNDGYSLSILGRHNQIIRKDKILASTSTRTLSPVLLNQIAREGRVWQSGILEVNHNKAGFTAQIEPNQLTWSRSCCHPVSGSLNVSFSGSKSGQATISFSSCGQGTIIEGEESRNFELAYCE